MNRRGRTGLLGVIGVVAALTQIVPSQSAKATPVAGGTITITAFRDYNANATQDPSGTGEPGLGAVKVVATCVTVDLNSAALGGPYSAAPNPAPAYSAPLSDGRYGLGGLTVGEDDRTLWVVNLETKDSIE